MRSPVAAPAPRTWETMPAPTELLQRLHRRVRQLTETKDPHFVEIGPDGKRFLKFISGPLIFWLSIDEASLLCLNFQNTLRSEIMNWIIDEQGFVREGGSIKFGESSSRENQPSVLPVFLVRNILSYYDHPGCPPEIEVEPPVKNPPQAVGWGRRVISQLLGLLSGGRG